MRSMSLKLSGLLCLLVMVSAALGVASSASAALPEALGTSAFSFTSKAGELTTASGLAIKCKSDKGSGEVVSSTELTTNVSFEKCTILGLAAQSLGDKSGIILIGPLVGHPCYINASAKKVGILFTLPSEGVHLEVPSLSALLLIKGSVVGAITPVNSSTTAYTLTFANPNEKCEGATGTQDELLVELEHSGETELGTEISTETITMASAIEIMA